MLALAELWEMTVALAKLDENLFFVKLWYMLALASKLTLAIAK